MSRTSPEREPLTAAALPPGDVHVWRAELDAFLVHYDGLFRILSEDERMRASRLLVAAKRERFVVARSVLRLILSGYCRRSPEDLAFVTGPHGKPGLVGGDVQFNLSHADGIAVYAMARQEVGIDLEAVRPDPELERLARYVFNPRELAEFLALPASERSLAFFAAWTRKEAFLKALGSGLSIPPDHVTVTIAPNLPASVLELAGFPDEAERWEMRELSIEPCVAATLVVQKPCHRVVHREFTLSTVN